MGFMDQLRKLTQPYDDEDDFFEDSDTSLRQAANVPPVGSVQAEFEKTFGEEPAMAPEPAVRKAPSKPSAGLSFKRQSRPKAAQREKLVNFNGNDTQVILFNPKSFEEAGELVTHLNQNRSLVVTFEGLPNEQARRLLDFLSGITYALQGKITPVSGKTYFITPHNVDILDPQQELPESDEQFF